MHSKYQAACDGLLRIGTSRVSLQGLREREFDRVSRSDICLTKRRIPPETIITSVAFSSLLDGDATRVVDAIPISYGIYDYRWKRSCLQDTSRLHTPLAALFSESN